MSINLKRVSFNYPLRSKPLDDNFQDIETQVNTNTTAIATLSSAAGSSEVVEARGYGYTTLYNALKEQFKLLGNGVITYNRTLDTCDTTTFWTAGTGATALDTETTNFVEGSASIKLGKSGTSTATIYYDIDFTNTEFDNKYITLSLFVADSTTLTELTSIHVDLTPDANFSTNYRRYTFTAGTDVVTGWNTLTLEYNNPTSTTGTVVDTATIALGRIGIQTDNATDTIASGDILVDYIRYYGDELKTVAQDTPDMTVDVMAGQCNIEGKSVLISSNQTSGTITAPSANPRIDIVCIRSDGTLRILQGVESATPSAPPTPYNHIKLAEVYLRVGATSIKDTDDSTNAYITDTRDLIADLNTIGNDLTTHTNNNITSSNTVHGILQGTGNGFDADKLDSYDASNASGDIPISNGTVNTNLNADKLDGYDASNSTASIPISNGTVNTNLNADKLDGADLSIDGEMAANSDAKVPTEKAIKTFLKSRPLSWHEIGTETSIVDTIGNGKITAIAEDLIAFYDATNDEIRTYKFDGTTWYQTGSGLSTASSGTGWIATLSNSAIAFIDYENDELRAYTWGGSNWSQAGSGAQLSITVDASGIECAMCGLSATRVALYNYGSGTPTLTTYDWNGNAFQQTGNSLSLTGAASASICMLSSTRVAFQNNGTDDLAAYDFDGTDWSIVGNASSISGMGNPSICALSEKRIVSIDDGYDTLGVYDFDGTDWALVGNGYNLANSKTVTSFPCITALTPTRIVCLLNGAGANIIFTTYEGTPRFSTLPSPAFSS